MKIDGRQLHHLRFAVDIVLIASSISQAELMLADFNKQCGKVSHRLNYAKTMFMKNRFVDDAAFMFNEINISECSSFVYLVREVNMMNGLAPDTCIAFSGWLGVIQGSE